MYKKNMLKHYLTFIALLLMELNYGLQYSHMISFLMTLDEIVREMMDGD